MPDDPIQPQLVRNPSLLERLKWMNFSSLYRSDSMEAEREGEGEDECQGSNSGHDSGNLVKRSKSEAHEESPAGLPEKMRKSASEKLSSSRRAEEEEVATVERRRPETARMLGGKETASCGEDEAVDAKADDFINRFKQQLKLQRLDSFLRYREMLKGN